LSQTHFQSVLYSRFKVRHYIRWPRLKKLK
jgi:hypothetical protein